MLGSNKPPQVGGGKPAGLFAGLRDAAVTTRGNFLKPGSYVVRVKKAIWKGVRKPPNSFAFILEFDIVKSSGAEANAEGTSASWYQSCADPAVGFGALKGFAANITGSNYEDPEFLKEVEPFLDAVVKGSVDEEGNTLNDGAINGWLLPVEVIVVQTKPKPNFPNGTPFSLHKWGLRIEEGE